MIRRNFLVGLATSGILAAGRQAVADLPSTSPLSKGFVKTSLGADAWFEVHGNPNGLNVFLAGPVFSRTLVPTNIKLQTQIKEGYIRHLGDLYKLLMSDYPHLEITTKNQNATRMTVENVCKDYLAVADAAGMDRFAAAGYSWGGNSVLQLATRSHRVAALVVGGWPVIDGPYQMLLKTVQKLHQESPERAEIGRYVNYYESLQDWPERAEIARLTCPRLNYIDASDGDDTDFIGRFRRNKKTLQELGWETAEVNSGDGHFGGVMPDIACPVIRTFLDKHYVRT
jgi:pimeloyl-ACP methyl ester carboxylesterase